MRHHYNSSIIKGLLLPLFFAGALLNAAPILAQSPGIPACNTPVPFTNPGYAVAIVTGNMPGHIPIVNPQPWTGNFGAALGGVTNAGHAVDADTGTVAGFIYVLAASGGARLTVESSSGTLPAGYFAGFDIRNTGIFGASLLGSLTVRTYLGNTLRESYTGNSGALTANLLSDDGSVRTGFVTSMTFDRVQIEQNHTLGINLGTTHVLHAVIGRFCAESLPRPCNQAEHWANPAFPVLVNNDRSGIQGLACVNCVVRNPGHVTDNDPATYAEIDFLGTVASTGALSVKNVLTTYPAGTFAGFEIRDIRAAGLSFGSTHTVTTFLDGVQQESIADGTGLGGGFFTSSGHLITGFQATLPFNEVQLRVTHTGAAGAAPTRVYGAVVKRFCAGPAPACNVNTPITEPAYPVFVDGRNTFINALACTQCDIVNASHAIDADPSNYTELVVPVGLGTEAAYAVSDGTTLYPGGTFAGFDIETPNLANATALDALTISTTLADGSIVESFTGGSLISAGTAFLNGSGRQTVGFVATQPFSGMRIKASSLLNASIGTTRIYSAVLKNFCPRTGACGNLPSFATTPLWPVYVNGARTGIEGVGCVGCQINSSENVIDANTGNYADMVLLSGIGVQGRFSVKDQLATHPAGSFAGMAISSPSLLDAGALSAFTINTYNDGVPAESKTGTALLLSAGSSLISGSGSMITGFVTTQPFDEVQIVATNLASVTIGTLRIYGAIFQEFCPKDVQCNTRYKLTQPEFPVVIDAGLTGLTGIACGICHVNDADHLLTADTTDFATIFTGAGVGSVGSIAVQDALSTYPKGTFAGFAVQSTPNVLLAALLSCITITTYLDGVPRESRSGGSLLDLDVLFPIFGPGNGLRNIGFVTTMSFDEVRISAGNLASAGINNLLVYYALVDTHGSDDSTGLDCNHKVSGHIFNDANGLNDTPPTVNGNSVNGPDIDNNASGMQDIHVSLVQGGQVVSTVPVSPAGTYFFPGAAAGNYQVVLHTSNSGSVSASLHSEWVHTGEHTGAGPGHDGNPDGVLLLGTLSSDKAEVNFGINRRPVPDTITTPDQFDPGGMASIPVPASAFAGTDPEPDGGIISLTIAPFPSGTNSITVNGTLYTAASFPAAGVTVPTNTAGQPVQPISIDPQSGSNMAIIPYQVKDLANTASSSSGFARLPLASPLPVDFGALKVVAGLCTATLSFETLSERNSLAFIIEHSADGRRWTSLAALAAAGNSSRQTYHYIHQGIEGLHHYRIRHQSADGAGSFSQVVSTQVDCGTLNGTIRIYPNPAHDILYLEGAPTGTEIAVYNASGLLMKKGVLENGMLRLEDLPSGQLYLLRLRYRDGEQGHRFLKL